jgi:hypothetical protein
MLGDARACSRNIKDLIVVNLIARCQAGIRNKKEIKVHAK